MDKVTKEQRAVITWLVWYRGERLGSVESPSLSAWEADLVEELCREGFEDTASKLEDRFYAYEVAE